MDTNVNKSQPVSFSNGISVKVFILLVATMQNPTKPMSVSVMENSVKIINAKSIIEWMSDLGNSQRHSKRIKTYHLDRYIITLFD